MDRISPDMERIVQEVIRRLEEKGTAVTPPQHEKSPEKAGTDKNEIKRTERIPMDEYRTPVLTEKHIQKLHELTGEIVVPCGTVITPRAREAVRKLRIIVTFE